MKKLITLSALVFVAGNLHAADNTLPAASTGTVARTTHPAIPALEGLTKAFADFNDPAGWQKLAQGHLALRQGFASLGSSGELIQKCNAATRLQLQLATSSADALAKLNSSGAVSTARVADLPLALQQEIQGVIQLQKQADAASKEADDFEKALKAAEEAAAHKNNQ